MWRRAETSSRGAVQEEPVQVSRAARGAASEMVAAAHFMLQGWHVLRSESPSCPFDLVIHKDGQLLRVEVKSVTETGYSPTFALPANDQWDRLAIVDRSGKVLVLEQMGGDELRAHFRAWAGIAPRKPMRRGITQWELRHGESA